MSRPGLALGLRAADFDNDYRAVVGIEEQWRGAGCADLPFEDAPPAVVCERFVMID